MEKQSEPATRIRKHTRMSAIDMSFAPSSHCLHPYWFANTVTYDVSLLSTDTVQSNKLLRQANRPAATQKSNRSVPSRERLKESIGLSCHALAFL